MDKDPLFNFKKHSSQIDNDLLFNCEKSSLEIYHCKHCAYKTDIVPFYSGHFKKIHVENKKNLSPSICGPTMWCRSLRHTCRKCQFSSFSLFLFLTHNLNYHPSDPKPKKQPKAKPEKWHQCNQCDYKVKLKKDFLRHKRTEHKFHNNCNHCEYKSPWINNLRKHILDQHTGPENVPKYECNICEYKSKTKKNLKRHIIQLHTAPWEIDWHRCELCNYKSKIKADLARHVKLKHRPEENVRKYECKTCAYITEYRESFKRHVIEIHGAPEEILDFIQNPRKVPM